MQLIMNNHELRIDMYFKMEMPDVLHRHSNQITFDEREAKIHIYKRFMAEYKQLIKADAEFSLILAVYDSNGVKMSNVVKCTSCDNIKQFHVNYNYINRHQQLFQIIQ